MRPPDGPLAEAREGILRLSQRDLAIALRRGTRGAKMGKSRAQVPWKPWWSLSVLFDPGRIRQAEWTMS